MTKRILSSTFLFRYACPCIYQPKLWHEDGARLSEECRLPSFGELDGRRVFADVRGGWNEEGLVFWVRVGGKRQLPWSRASRVEDSDGLTVYIDTRATQNIHRASRFCHCFSFLPVGSGPRFENPTVEMMMIARARENPKPPPGGSLVVRVEKRIDGYTLHARVDAAALTGFDPREQPRLGFTYAVHDREFGWQTFTVSEEFPFAEDPSLWGTLELVK